jgi:hypothetical protein
MKLGRDRRAQYHEARLLGDIQAIARGPRRMAKCAERRMVRE